MPLVSTLTSMCFLKSVAFGYFVQIFASNTFAVQPFDDWKAMKLRDDRGSAGAGTLVLALFILVFCLVFFFGFYIPNWAPHTYPTDHTNFWFGVIHGFMALPTFLYSLFDNSVTIYQSPNDGNWYNFGYVLGAGILFGGSKARS